MPRAKGDTAKGKKGGSKTRSTLAAVSEDAGIPESTAPPLAVQLLAKWPEAEPGRRDNAAALPGDHAAFGNVSRVTGGAFRKFLPNPAPATNPQKDPANCKDFL